MKTEPFRRFALLLVPALGALVVGCGSTIENGESDDGAAAGTGGEGGGTVEEECGGVTSTEHFQNGGMCPLPGTLYCDSDDRWSCREDSPSTTASSSTGDVGMCPEVAPPPDAACSVEGMTCEVPSDLDCGPATITITCVDGSWAQIGPRCSLPACRDVADTETCVAIGCRWLEPGCGEMPLAEAGCFEATECVPDGCLFSDEICMVVSVEPACANQDPACGACGEDARVCVPQLLGEGGGDAG